MKCIQCNVLAVAIKKRGLCLRCYQRQVRNEKKASVGLSDVSASESIKKHENAAELEFVKNFFNHKNWFFEPTLFRFSGGHYTPDFYDAERNVFIEVAGTRQAYHANKEKYALFRKTFPLIKFEIRQSDGSLLDETEGRLQWTVISNQE